MQLLMLEIKTAQAEDALRLSVFAEATFRETFAPYNSESDMQLYSQKTFSPDKQRQEILDPDKRVVLALWAEEIIGYYMLSLKGAEASISGPRPIQLSRLYVDSRWHGQKIAHRLLEEAMNRSRQEGFFTFWMGVWEKNYRALAFYKKWGFEEVGDLRFELGQDVQRDLLFTKPL